MPITGPAQATTFQIPTPQTHRPADVPKELRGSGLNAIHGQSDGRVRANLAKELGMAPTIKGRSLSPGRALGSLLRLPGRGLRLLGAAMQGKNQRFSTSENKARYLAGGIFKTLGNLWGGAAGLVGGAVVFAEHKISDFGGFALRAAGAGLLGAGSLLAYGAGKLAGNTSAGEAGLRMARDLVLNSPLLSRRAELDVTAAIAREFSGDLAAAMGSNDIDPRHHLKNSDLPPGLTDRFKFGVRKEDNGTGIPDIPVISTGGWTKLTVLPTWGEPLTARNQDQPRILYLNYQGSNFSADGFGTDTGMQGLANARTDVAQGLGIPDGAFREARDIAKMFIDHYKDTNVTVRLVGHSMGGALAQYAGISASTPDSPVRVTCFNSAGLHPHLLEKLGADKIDISNVTHFTNTAAAGKNIAGDPMQFVDGKNNPLVPTLKVGVLYAVPITKLDHGMQPIRDHFNAV